jgi:hypothetical protein
VALQGKDRVRVCEDTSLHSRILGRALETAVLTGGARSTYPVSNHTSWHSAAELTTACTQVRRAETAAMRQVSSC